MCAQQRFLQKELPIYEPVHDKTNKMTSAPSEDSDQPGHPPRLISHCCLHEEQTVKQTVKTDQIGLMSRLMWTAKTDQTGLILVFAGRTCHFIGFVVQQLNYERLFHFFFSSSQTHFSCDLIDSNDLKFLDRQVWGSSVDQHPTVSEAVWSVYTICHSVCSFWTHYSMVLRCPKCLVFRQICTILKALFKIIIISWMLGW